jgi:hypothetical protein
MMPPCFNCDIDRGVGAGGSITYLTLLYRAFVIAHKREMEKIRKEQELKKLNKKGGDDLMLSE